MKVGRQIGFKSREPKASLRLTRDQPPPARTRRKIPADTGPVKVMETLLLLTSLQVAATLAKALKEHPEILARPKAGG